MAKSRLLQDQFQTHYLPGVGRQVMAEGGGINLPYDADKEPYGAGGLPYGGGKTPYSRKKPHKDGGGAVEDYNGPTLPIPDRMPNWGDVSKAVDVAKSFLTPPDPYEEAGKAVQQYRAGNPIDAAVTLASSLPQTGALYERKLSPMGFYSHGAEAAHNLPQETMTVQQARKMLEKAGTKPDEFRWSGFDTAFADPVAKVSRPDLVRHFEENVPQLGETVLGGARPTEWRVSSAGLPMGRMPDNLNFPSEAEAAVELARREAQLPEGSHSLMDFPIGPRPKFDQYTLPGGENYREVLTTLPQTPGPFGNRAYDAANELHHVLHQKYGNGFRLKATPEELARLDELNERGGQKSPDYKSSHWDEPNVLAHLRMSERPGNVLHLEELQSDWGQEARKKGIVDPSQPRGLNDAETAEFRSLRNMPWDERTPEQSRRHDELMAIGNRRLEGVPDAPFINSTQNWTDLGLKRALYEAAKANAERLAWTPGAEQAARYDLSKQVKAVHYFPEHKSFQAIPHNGRKGISEMNVEPQDLEKYVGKDVARKLLEQPLVSHPVMGHKAHSLEGLDLSIGGEGMKGYYDKILPSRIQAVLKRAGVGNPEFSPLQVGDKEIPSLVLTPEMLAQIRKGMPYFADGGAAPSAAITGPHTITADDLIGRANYSAPSQGAYTDAGGQKIAAPYVTSMKNGYPVYGAPAADTSAFDPMSILSSLFGGRNGGNNAINNALNVAQSITPYTKVA